MKTFMTTHLTQTQQILLFNNTMVINYFTKWSTQLNEVINYTFQHLP